APAPATATPATGAASVPAPSALPGSVPQASTAATPAAGAGAVPGAGAPAVRERFTVSNDVMQVTFDTEGGSIVRTEFLQHAGANEQGNFVLLDQSDQRVYLAQSGLIGGEFPNHKTVMTVTTPERALAQGQDQLQVRFESPAQGGVK